MNIKRASMEVSKIKRTMGNNNQYAYREVTPSKINYKPAIFTLLSSVVMISGLFVAMYYFI